MRGLNWRVLAIVATVLLSLYLTVANFLPARLRHEHPLLPNKGIRLGLDLQGGISWVLGPQLDVAIAHELDFLRGNLQSKMQDAKLKAKRMLVKNGQLIVEMPNAEAADRVQGLAAEDTGVLHLVSSANDTDVFELTPAYAKEVRKRGMEQVLEVLRRRIEDPIRGVPDSVVTRQGSDQVLVQIPGGQLDRDQARKLLKVTGFLEFKIVLDEAPSEALLKAKYKSGLPEGTEIVPEYEPGTHHVTEAYLVNKTPDLTGEYLTQARARLDQRFGWVVDFWFNTAGANRFATLTEKNQGKLMAIILDGNVHSAPRIEERIGGGQGFIRGSFTAQSAADLAVILRSGSLPIPVKIEQERTVGPALGADSIHRGIEASILGFAFVVGFAVWYYRLSGLYASIALTSNLLMILAIMSLSQATLTMPGIAGLVLTVGMAVDANVIIFERIREELRLGKTPRASIRTGFNKALWTILDANITTLITALVLFQYGTGPVKGFAVTLSIGIVTSVFSAIVITRMLYDFYPGTRPARALSI